MKDTHLILDHYAYSFRYDIRLSVEHLPLGENNKEIVTKYLTQFKVLMEKYPIIKHYLAAYELGFQSRKPHIQSVIWSSSELTRSQTQSFRNYIRNKFDWKGNDGHVSFASAKKIQSLTSYCKKDGAFIHNLPPEVFSKIKNWRPFKQMKITQRESLEYLLEESPEENRGPYGPWCQYFNHKFTEVYKRPCCHRNTYFKYALKYKVITISEFLHRINVYDSQSFNQTPVIFGYQ